MPGNQYSDKELLQALRDLAEELGTSPTRDDMDQKGQFASSTYYTRFGTWNSALEAVNLEKNSARPTDEELLQALRDLTEELGTSPTADDMNREGQFSSGAYEWRFGSWNSALEAANLEKNPVSPTNEELLQALRELAEELGTSPTCDDMDQEGQFASNTYQTRFGAWNAALEAVDLEKNSVSPTNEELLQSLRELAEELGTSPTADDMDREGQFSSGAHAGQFGTWNSALEAADLEKNLTRPTDEELLQALCDLAEELGTSPTRDDMDQEGQFASNTYHTRFGTWNSALEAADLEKNSARPTDEELLQSLRKVAEELGTSPTADDMDREGQFSSSTYHTRFGTWNSALEAADLEKNLARPTNEELLSELKRLSDGELGPRLNDVASQSDYNAKTIGNRFGSYWRGVVAAGLVPQRRAPLTDAEFNEFHLAAINQQETTYTLAALLGMFTGLSVQMLEQMSESWIHERTYSSSIVRVPSTVTQSGEKWEFSLPSKFTTSNGKKRETHLPGLLEWYIDNNELPIGERTTLQRIIKKIAAKANLPTRPHIEQTTASQRSVSKVTLGDLQITSGIRMAHNGAPARRIRRHLGIEHTRWNGSVEDIFFYCDHRFDDFEHPDWDPN